MDMGAQVCVVRSKRTVEGAGPYGSDGERGSRQQVAPYGVHDFSAEGEGQRGGFAFDEVPSPQGEGAEGG